jgi:hypothetical protein
VSANGAGFGHKIGDDGHPEQRHYRLDKDVAIVEQAKARLPPPLRAE